MAEEMTWLVALEEVAVLFEPAQGAGDVAATLGFSAMMRLLPIEESVWNLAQRSERANVYKLKLPGRPGFGHGRAAKMLKTPGHAMVERHDERSENRGHELPELCPCMCGTPFRASRAWILPRWTWSGPRPGAGGERSLRCRPWRRP